jgi:hypothetical protein
LDEMATAAAGNSGASWSAVATVAMAANCHCWVPAGCPDAVGPTAVDRTVWASVAVSTDALMRTAAMVLVAAADVTWILARVRADHAA